MKQFLRYIFAVAAMLMVVVNDVWGTVLNSSTTQDLTNNVTNRDYKYFSLSGQGDVISFNYKLKKDASTTTHNIFVEVSFDNNNWFEIQKYETKSSSDQSASNIKIPHARIRYLRIGLGTAGSQDAQIWNVKVTKRRTPNNIVPFTIDSHDRFWLDFYYADNNNSMRWDNGVRLGSADVGSDAANSDDRYFVIALTCIPGTLSFDYERTVSIATGCDWYVEESSDAQNWDRTWSATANEGNHSYDLKESTKYIKFCYSGNYGGRFKNIKVTESSYANQPGPGVTSWDAGTAVIGSANATASTTMAWSNTEPFNLTLSGAGASQFSATISNNASTCAYGTATITANYKHDTVGTHNATLTISNGTFTHTIALSGTTIKKTQNIYWTENYKDSEPTLNIGQVVYNAAAATVQPVKYISSNPDIIEVVEYTENGTYTALLIAKAAGTSLITAYQEGNSEYNRAEISKTFRVSERTTQQIIWEDNLTYLLLGNQPITLTAKVFVNGVEDESRTALIKYTSANTNIVSVNGNTLTINGVGETTLTASVEGTDTYEPVSTTIPVRVLQPSSGCEDIPISYSGTTETGKITWTETQGGDQDITLDLTTGVPEKLSFTYRGLPFGLEATGILTGTIKVSASADGVNWTLLRDGIQTPSGQYGDDILVSDLPLSRNTKYIRFTRYDNNTATWNYGSYVINNIRITPAQYIESPEVIDLQTITMGVHHTKDYTISYSNIKDNLHISTENAELSFPQNNDILIDDCGSFGAQTKQFTFTPSQEGAFEGYITIKDNIANITRSIKIIANVIKNNQVITWNPTKRELTSWKDWMTNMVDPRNATTNSGLPVTYTMSPNDYAEFVDGQLVIKQSGGPFTITASQEGNELWYAATPISVEFNIPNSISPITFIGGNEDQNWNNTQNWNYGRTPTSTEHAFIQAPAILSSHTNVLGVTFTTNAEDQKSSIQITHNGGLTIGANGITNAASDGSSISIDNTPEGAGFLRINPNTAETNRAPRVTINYTTRAFDKGSKRNEIWQYMGAPGDNTKIEGLTNQTQIYNWDEQNGWVKQNNNELNPLPTWRGYALTQSVQENATYHITTTPIQGTHDINLTYTITGMNGDNLFVNSFLAPIDITKIDNSDIIETEEDKLWKIFYLFNSGSWNQWKGNGNHDMTVEGYDQSSAGHYYTIPIYSAQYTEDAQTIIPPMQGVYVYTEAPATIKLDYNKHVWTGATSNKPMRSAPIEDPDFQRVRIHIGSQNSGADRMYVIQTSNTTKGYDNGYDGDNINADGQVNIYTNEPFGKMEVSCSNNIDSMYIGFTAGEDSIYTLTFGATHGEIYLNDLTNDSTFQLLDNLQYHFIATPNSTNDLRFQVLLHPELPNQNQGSNDQGTTSDLTHTNNATIWAHGKTIYIANVPANSIATLYNISGQALITNTIPHTPYALNLSHMPKGVYILRINNHAYKFISE